MGEPGRAAWPAQLLLVVLAALVVGGGSALLFSGTGDSGGIVIRNPSPKGAAQATVVERDKVLSKGGYNAWAGAFVDTDRGSVMTAFVNVTGPAAPPCAQPNVPNVPEGCDDRGFRGATHRYVLLESRDGKAWKRRKPDETLPPAAPHAVSGQAIIALRADQRGTRTGTLLRRVNGEDLARFPENTQPGTGYLQRLAPGGKEWQGRTMLLDPERYTANISRLVRLQDGRTLLAVGAFWRVPAGGRIEDPDGAGRARWMLLRSTDEGRTWRNALAVPDAVQESAPANEWDVAELPDGDLLAVMRTRQGDRPVRKQVVLQRTSRTITTNTGTRSESGWRMGRPRLTPAGFPQVDRPQHPELVEIREGPGAGGILHIADEGVHYTGDGGRTWQPLQLGGWTPHYYPNAVQGPDGDIYVFSHGGGDEHYEAGADKPVYVDRLRMTGPDPES